MSHLSTHRNAITTTILLFAVLSCGSLSAQDGGTVVNTEAAVQQWIVDLGSPVFKTRQTASAALAKAGPLAIEPLKRAEQTAGLEQKARIAAILEQLQENSFAHRLAALKREPSIESAAGLPEWERFASIVGADAKCLALYIRLLSAEPELFATAMNEPTKLRQALQIRAAEVLQAARPSTVDSRPFSVDSYAALLLLASNNDLLLQGNTSTSINTLLIHAPVLKAVQQNDGAHYLRLLGTWILRERIALEKPFQFARKQPLPEGLTLARNTLKTALRGQNGIWAMMLLLEQGATEDLTLIESLFDNQGVLFRARNNTYSALNGDMALAVAVAMRKQDPRDYGFGKTVSRAEPFRFELDTIGFSSDAERQQARQKYRDQFLAAAKPTE